jgi:hypothetical protein
MQPLLAEELLEAQLQLPPQRSVLASQRLHVVRVDRRPAYQLGHALALPFVFGGFAPPGAAALDAGVFVLVFDGLE